jgi:hypothetical protein
VDEGKLLLNAGATLPATTLRLGASGTLDLGGTSQTFASLVGSGCVTNGSLALGSGGAIYPGGVGTTGTLALDVASFTAPAGTTLAVDVGDRVDVSCAVDISGWNLSVSNPESLTGDGPFVVMKASGGLVGNYASVPALGKWVVAVRHFSGEVQLVRNGFMVIVR